MGTPKDIWHCARPLLAKQYLAEFDLGLISARALFAKRRMGKSGLFSGESPLGALFVKKRAKDGGKQRLTSIPPAPGARSKGRSCRTPIRQAGQHSAPTAKSSAF